MVAVIIIIIIITEYLVSLRQRVRLKGHYSVTRVNEESKAILNNEFLEHV